MLANDDENIKEEDFIECRDLLRESNEKFPAEWKERMIEYCDKTRWQYK